MRTIFTTFAVMLLLVGTSQSQEPGQGRGRGEFNPDQIVDRMFEQDANSDGKLAKDEVSERMAGMFERADADEDGFLTKDELKAMFASRMRERGGGGRGEGGERGQRGGGRGIGGQRGGPARMLRMIPVIIVLDADKNGELSAEEIKNAVTALKTLDKDGDGKISAEEMAPDFSQMMGAGRQRPDRPSRPSFDDDDDDEDDNEDDGK